MDTVIMVIGIGVIVLVISAAFHPLVGIGVLIAGLLIAEARER